MTDLRWMTARPIAHRGLHDPKAGAVENTMTAFRRATEHGFNFELDVHLSADGEVFVHHDDVLGRLNEGSGPVAAMTMDELRAVSFKSTTDRMPTLAEVFAMVAGRVGVVVEVKSDFGARNRDIVAKVAEVVRGYGGPVAVKSFDPRMIEDLAEIAPEIARGIVADDAGNASDYNGFAEVGQSELAALAHYPRSKPHFVSYWVKLLPNAISRRVREDWQLPLITWTVRTADDRKRAATFADQMVFEGFMP